MVALAVRYLGETPVVCDARPLLFAASDFLQRGLYAEAGCRLHEAVRRFLHAECEYHHCLPPAKQRHELPPIVLAKALRKAGQLQSQYFEFMTGIIEIGKKATRLAFDRPAELASAIKVMHMFLDGSPYLVQPLAGGRA